MKMLSVKEVSTIIDLTWNACVDFHNNQGENDVKFPNLDEVRNKLLGLPIRKTEFRKLKIIGEDSYEQYPMETDIEFDTLGLYRNNQDGTSTLLDKLPKIEMEKFRAQDDFEEVMVKLNGIIKK